MPLSTFYLYSWADIGFPSGYRGWDAEASTHTVTGTPDIAHVFDDDDYFQEVSSNATASPDNGAEQMLEQDLLLDGAYPFAAGTTIWSQASATIINSTTGQLGTIYVISLGDGSENTQWGFVSTIPLQLGDTFDVGAWNFAEDQVAYNQLHGPDPLDHVVEGSEGDDLIDAAYAQDPQGDRVDNDDAADGSNDDEVQAGGGNDTVSSLAGNDLVFGGTGHDSLDGGAGSDTLFGGAGNDILHGGEGDDSLSGEAGSDTIHGDAGDDLITAGAGNDVIFGGEGSDTIGIGGSDQFDIIHGGEDASGTDNDLLDLYATAPGEAVTVTFTGDEAGGFTFAGSDTSGTFQGIETLSLTVEADVLDATAASQRVTVFAGAGDDTLHGGSGADLLAGGADADAIHGGSGDRVLGGEDGHDHDTLYVRFSDVARITYGGGDNESGDILFNDGGTLTFSGIESIVYAGAVDGTEGDDLIEPGYADFQNDQIDGTDGLNDFVCAGGGNDTIRSGEGNDLVDAGAGDDVVFGGAGNDTLAGADGQNTLYGGEGDDSLIGASTDIGAFTILDGGSGADTLDGTAGQWDIASYFDSDAAVAIDLTDGLAETGGAAQGDILVGIEQVDGANLHNDTLTAGHSGMTLRGWGGNDTLIGGRGNDLLLGDAGSDTFRLSDSFGHDTIQGGTGYDTIDLSGLSRPVVVVFSGPGAGSITDMATGHTITFSDIEELILTPFADQVDAGPDNGHTYIQTRNGNDLLHGSAGDDVYDDEIFTPNGQGSDTFYGAAGNDVLWMGTDNDLAFGGDGSDRLEGQEGDDTLNGDAGDDLLSGGEGDDTLAGGTGNDALHGGADRDLFLLEDGFAADAISGGEDGDDIDVIDAGAMSQAVQVAFTGDEAGSVVSGANTAAFSGVEGFSLTDQADDLDATGSAAAVVAGGAGGNDTLVGGAGDDVLSGDGRYANLIQNGSFETTTGMTVTSWGYRGDTATAPGGWYTGAGGVIDIHHSGSGAPSDGANWLDMEAVAGIDTVSQAVQGVIAGQSYTLRFDAIDPVGDNAVNVFWNGTLIDTIAPGTGAHRTYSYDLVGGAGDGSNILTFQSLGPLDMTGVALDNVQFLGFSSLDAGAGNDSLNGGAGDDLLIGGAGNDTLVGGAGADTLIGGDGYDIIEYSDSGSAVFIDLGDDLPEQGGEAQGDVLSGFEMIGGSQQDDVIILGDTAMDVGANGGNDSVVGGAGNDRVWAGFGHDTVSGGGGDDLLSGQEGDDLLDGGLGADTLEGGAGADRLTGGAGNDLVVLGMDGAQDVIVFGDGDGSDTLTGLDAPTDNGDGTFTGVDRLDVSHLTDAAGARVNTGDVTVTDDGAGNAVLGFPNGETLTLLGISPATADNPAWLAALGIPAPDFVVDGTASADLIDTTYTSDPEGDMVDAGDAADGSHDDVIDAGAGDDTVFAGDGNDTLDGGAGADTLDGGTGDDVISVGSGDAAAGGAGDDLFLVTPAMLDGGALFIDGGEDDETFGDTLNITGPASIVLDGSNPENGTVTWLDGTTLTFQNIENVAYTPCFTENTLIKTRRGEVPAAQLRIGDMVLTRNHGYQPIRWIGIRHLDRAELSANPALNPVVIRAGALGPHTPERDLTVSPQHRMLIGGGRAQLWFEEDEVFVSALHLTCVDGVAQIRPDSVTYVHILFDCHQIVSSDGAWSESYQPGDLTLAGMDEEQRAELFAIFPELFDGPPGQRYPAARITLKRHEVPLLFA